MTKMTIKEWKFNQIQSEARRYNMWIDVDYTEINGDNVLMADENGNITVHVNEILKETEKAVQVKLATGATDGSAKGFMAWIPKSIIAA